MQICRHPPKKTNFCDEITGKGIRNFFFLSLFLFFSKFFRYLARISGLSQGIMWDNFVHGIIISIMDNTSIKQNIRKVRKSRKLTQEEMAYRLGVSLTAYRDLEKGETSIINTNLMKVASLLDTTTEELVLGYSPIQMMGPGVEDIKEEYLGKVSVMKKRIEDLERLVHSLEETISTKNEIITMLKKSLDKDK